MPVPSPYTLKNAPMRGVAANGLATVEIPPVGTIYSVYLYCKAGAGTPTPVADIKTSLTNLEMKVDGKPVIQATPTFLLDLQKFYGDRNNAGNVAGVVPLFLARPNLVFPAAQSAFALGTRGVGAITLEVTCGAVLTNLASIDVFVEASNEDRAPGSFLTILKYPQNFATTGEQEISTLPKEPGSGLLAMHVEKSTGTIDDMTVVMNRNEISTKVPTNLQKVILEKTGRVPQASYYHVAFDRMNELESRWDMDGVNDFRTKITWSGAAPNNYNIYLERVMNLK